MGADRTEYWKAYYLENKDRIKTRMKAYHRARWADPALADVVRDEKARYWTENCTVLKVSRILGCGAETARERLGMP